MLKIQTWEKNEILRTKSDPIKANELDQYIKLWKEMIKYIKDKKNHWVGLAAPQVGYNKRLFVVSLLKNWDDENFPTLMMINPEITFLDDAKDKENEWCLSLPGESGEVERCLNIMVSFIDDKKKRQTLKLSGTSARIVQHENDHIDGILFTDRVKK